MKPGRYLKILSITDEDAPPIIPAILIITSFVIASRILFMDDFFYNIDEAVYAVIARAWTAGMVPKVGIWGNATKPPGMEFIYMSIFKLGGESFFSIRMVCLVCVLLMTLLTYAICKLLFGDKAALLSSIFLTTLMCSAFNPIDLMAFNSEIPQMVFVLSATYIFLLSFKNDFYLRLFISGLLSILAVLIRQNSLIHFGGLLVYLLFLSGPGLGAKDKIRGSLVMLAGACIGLLPVILYYASINGLNELWYHSIIFPIKYAGDLSYGRILVKILSSIPRTILTTLPVTALALSFLLSRQNNNRDKLYKHLHAKRFISVWFLFCALSVCPGWRFFGHYFIQVFPALSVLAGAGCVGFFDRRTGPNKSIFLNLLIYSYIIISVFNANFSYIKYLRKETRYSHSLGRKGLEVAVGEYIKDNTATDDKIFVWGFCPQIYWHSGRLPAVKDILCEFTTGYSPGTLGPRIKKSPRSSGIKDAESIMHDDLMLNKPKYIIDVSRVYSYTFIFKSYPVGNYPLIDSFIRDGYRRVKNFDNVVIYEAILGKTQES